MLWGGEWAKGVMCVCVLTVHMLPLLKDRHGIPVCCDALQSEVPGVWVETAAIGP